MMIFSWTGALVSLAFLLLVLALLLLGSRHLAVTLTRASSWTLAAVFTVLAGVLVLVHLVAAPLATWTGWTVEALAAWITSLALVACAVAVPTLWRAVQAAKVTAMQIPQAIYADAIKHAPVALIVLDDVGRIRYAEGGALENAGWLRPGMLGQHATTALPPSAARAVEEVWEGAMAGHTTRHRVYTAHVGSVRWYSLTGAPTQVQGARAVVLAVELDGVEEAKARVQAHLESIERAWETEDR